MNIIFVCTGNTCRSPMAEGYAKSLFPNQTILSRGLMVAPGSAVSDEAVSVLKDNGIDISKHTPKQLSYDDINSADLILTMTKSQSDYLKSLSNNNLDRIFSLSEYTNTSDIADPFGKDKNEYAKCFEQIKEAVNILYSKICHE